jgi:hypothetical protein
MLSFEKVKFLSSKSEVVEFSRIEKVDSLHSLDEWDIGNKTTSDATATVAVCLCDPVLNSRPERKWGAGMSYSLLNA